ncbi:hypothetical protein EGW08_010476 [Elysia chlorotica]|uniref:Uncharacterized protein n=1 Tax=Elysia chlorotica TaxID=188477 RepID=A0A3S1C3B6_ELYCH|nr:hypothetical protein EGW08_010476 [Elysia chlorotica]
MQCLRVADVSLVELNGWKAYLMFSEDVQSIEIWDADATKVSDREYILVNKSYNPVQHIGDWLCLSFLGRVEGNGDISPETTVYIEGMDEPTDELECEEEL